MMYHFLGESTFVEGLTLYLNRHKYGNAEQDDLWAAYTEVAHSQRSLRYIQLWNFRPLRANLTNLIQLT